MNRRLRPSFPILLLALTFCWGAGAYTVYECYDHRGITHRRAIEILQNETGHALRQGATFSLDLQFTDAYRILKHEADAGDKEAAATLAHWREVLTR